MAAGSDSTMRDAVKLYFVFLLGLAGLTVVLYLQAPELLIYLIPVYVGAGILLVFVIMWVDEERMKERYFKSRLNR